jgi:hypothetical protein
MLPEIGYRQWSTPLRKGRADAAEQLVENGARGRFCCLLLTAGPLLPEIAIASGQCHLGRASGRRCRVQLG